MELISIKEAAAKSGLTVGIISGRVRAHGVRHVRLDGRSRLYRPGDLKRLLWPPGQGARKGAPEVWEPPEGAVTISEYCRQSGHKQGRVRYQAARHELDRVPGTALTMYMRADLDDMLAGRGRRLDDAKKSLCRRCGRPDKYMRRRGGLCLDCWCGDYCRAKGI